jgi:DNA-binding NtrC family response regulator
MTLTTTPFAEELATTDIRQRSMTALVIDDSKVDRKHLRDLCRKAGLRFACSEAATIAEMDEHLDRTAFDFVFIDYNLGVETGMQALKAVTSHEDQMNAIPIMVTGVDRPDVIIEAMRSGCADYLVKEEITIDSIRRAVTSALERRVLLAALSRERSTRVQMSAAIERFSQSCAPGMRGALAVMLRRIRSMQAACDPDPVLHDGLKALGGDCQTLFGFLDEMHGMIAADNRPALAPPAELRPH